MIDALQRILVVQQRNRGETKISGIEKHGSQRFAVEVLSIPSNIPELIDDTSEYLPNHIDADLVLDYLCHPDLSHDLAVLCRRQNIPVIASGRRIDEKWAITPPTCCGLTRKNGLGRYGLLFGMPEYEIDIQDGVIQNVVTVRGAPCGASWDAVKRVVGLTTEEALVRMGLETQFFCTADPSAWDPIYGKSPVHRAAEFHKTALILAIKRCAEKLEAG